MTLPGLPGGPPLRAFQDDEITLYAHIAKRAIFASPRLGKTLIGILSMQKAGPFKRGLVVCPLIVASMWCDLLAGYGFDVMRGYEMSVAEIERRLEMDEPEVIIVLNYDKVPRAVDALIAWHPEAVIADESHYIKAHNSLRGKAVRRIAKRAKWVRLLTGTPTPNHYGDLWGQMACIDDRPLALDGWGSWTAFKARYLIMDAIYPTQVRGHNPLYADELQKRLLRDSMFKRREDVFGPDQFQPVVREVHLPPKARALYTKLAKEWILEADASSETPHVRADHILKRIIRLQEIAAGFLADEFGEKHFVHGAKLDAVRADLGEIIEYGEKVVIFHQRKWEGPRYLEIARDVLGAERADKAQRIYGDTPTHMRDHYVDAFNQCEGPAVLVVQTQTAGIGISLKEADHVFFTTQSFSFDKEDQARDRSYAQDETSGVKARVVTYYRAVGTIDEYIAEVLRTKQRIHQAVRLADRETMAFGRIARPARKIA